MNFRDSMAELKSMGTAQNVKIYKRHGAGEKLYGVSFANLGKLKRKIKIDHGLALKLWNSGNADAQTLATMIADPNLLTPADAENWVSGIRYYLLSDLHAGLVAKTKFAQKKMVKWMIAGGAKNEYVRQCGYNILACLLRNGVEISDDDCKKYLKTIEIQIKKSPNRARHAMNMALIAIGIYRPKLTKAAIASARKIGKVEVDHGETSCKTPDAIGYIEKALKRMKKKSGKG